MVNVVTRIKKHLESLPPDRDESIISMSSIGHCGRQLAYRHHKVDPTPYTYSTQAAFQFGRMYHDVVRGWLKKALVGSTHRLTDMEKDVLLQVWHGDGQHKDVCGHIDGILRGRNKGHDHYLLEVKIMS